MSEDLVTRLRDLGDHAAFEPHAHHEAADEIKRLRAGGCARDQTTTQFCAEATTLQRRLDTLERQMPAIIEYLEDHADVVDGDNGIPHPNKAMTLLVWLRHAMEGKDEQ